MGALFSIRLFPIWRDLFTFEQLFHGGKQKFIDVFNTLGKMFDGDEDFNFVDEDFLLEAFHPAAVNDIVQKRSDEYEKQSFGGGVLSKYPLMNGPQTVPEEKASSCSNKGNENKKEKSSFKVSNTGNENKEKSSFKFISSVNGCAEKFTSDDSFQFDDDFPFENFDIDERDHERSDIVSTPSDCEFTQCSNFRLCNQTKFNKELNTDSTTSCHSVKKDDFRSRILQTLKGSKCVNSVTHDNLPPPSPLNSVINASIDCVSKTGRKRTSSDSAEIRKEDTGPPLKKLYKQSHGACGSYSTNVSHSTETTNILDNLKVHCQTEFNNLPKTNKVPGENNLLPRRQQLTPITSPKQVAPNTWKTSSLGGPVIQKRKFPGPAGILPQLGSDLMVPDNQQLHEKSPATVTQNVVCSQSSAYDFSRGPWQQMINDLELNTADPACPLQVFNIKWVLRRASLRGQAGVRKVPFLAVLVRSLDMTHNDATAVLKDPTGEMNGTVASSVMDEYGPTLQSGSVLLLRGVTVLSPVGLRATTTLREHTRHHYLNITLNTVLTIYTPDESGDVIITSVGKVDKRELCKQAAAPKTAGGSRAIVEEEEDEIHGDFSKHSPSLFSNINESFGSFSGKLNHSTPMARLPNYKSPKFTANITQQCSFAQPQKFNQQYSPGTATRNGGHLVSVGPRMITPTNNRKIQNQGISTSSVPFQPHFQQSPVRGAGLVTSHQPLVKHPSLLNSSMHGKRLEKSLTSPQNFSSQAEEKEVSELLDGVDTDSLFGDF
ncbi:uncharacterized protein [Panulirus ornatus]|uniref:uncharacterized protein n=1 Tax=Panulirus ornatus TaxID=150431 RepID=UPI003A8C7F6C